jgi:hypothetical protein
MVSIATPLAPVGAIASTFDLRSSSVNMSKLAILAFSASARNAAPMPAPIAPNMTQLSALNISTGSQYAGSSGPASAQRGPASDATAQRRTVMGNGAEWSGMERGVEWNGVE